MSVFFALHVHEFQQFDFSGKNSAALHFLHEVIQLRALWQYGVNEIANV